MDWKALRKRTPVTPRNEPRKKTPTLILSDEKQTFIEKSKCCPISVCNHKTQ